MTLPDLKFAFEINPVELLKDPHVSLQRLSFELMKLREGEIQKMRGKEATILGGGKLAEITYNRIVVYGPNNTRVEHPFPSYPTLRQLLTALTTLK